MDEGVESWWGFSTFVGRGKGMQNGGRRAVNQAEKAVRGPRCGKSSLRKKRETLQPPLLGPGGRGIGRQYKTKKGDGD